MAYTLDGVACECGQPAKHWRYDCPRAGRCDACELVEEQALRKARTANLLQFSDLLTPAMFDKVESYDEATTRMVAEVKRLQAVKAEAERKARMPVLPLDKIKITGGNRVVFSEEAKAAFRRALHEKLAAHTADGPKPIHVTTRVTGIGESALRKLPFAESGPGLAAKYPDATKAAKPTQEPITCDLGADWED